jgi:hypothetical protein
MVDTSARRLPVTNETAPHHLQCPPMTTEGMVPTNRGQCESPSTSSIPDYDSSDPLNDTSDGPVFESSSADDSSDAVGRKTSAQTGWPQDGASDSKKVPGPFRCYKQITNQPCLKNKSA